MAGLASTGFADIVRQNPHQDPMSETHLSGDVVVSLKEAKHLAPSLS